MRRGGEGYSSVQLERWCVVGGKVHRNLFSIVSRYIIIIIIIIIIAVQYQ